MCTYYILYMKICIDICKNEHKCIHKCVYEYIYVCTSQSHVVMVDVVCAQDRHMVGANATRTSSNFLPHTIYPFIFLRAG